MEAGLNLAKDPSKQQLAQIVVLLCCVVVMLCWLVRVVGKLVLVYWCCSELVIVV